MQSQEEKEASRAQCCRTAKKDPLPSATKAVSEAKQVKDDHILNSLDMYFKFSGSKSVMEISEEETDEDTKNE